MATAVVPKDVGLAFGELLDSDGRYDGMAVDVFETSPGRWRVAIYFETPPARRLVSDLNLLAWKAGASRRTSFIVERLPETDWVVKSLEGLAPVRAGRFVVHGRHDRAVLVPNDISIEIEAARAFGTGHHGTTLGCLIALEKALTTRTIRRAADIGTGSGVLAFAMAKAAHIPVLATDNDPIAVAVTRDNAALNGVAGHMRIATANGTSHRLFRQMGPFDLIVANILAAPLAAMAADIKRIAAPGAVVILSGLLPHQHRRIAATYRNAGFRRDRSWIVDGWLTVQMLRAGYRG